MANNKTTLGGAITATGTALVGIGVLTQLSQFSAGTPPSPKLVSFMWYVAAAGFILSAIGKGIHAYYSTDTQSVCDVASRVEEVAKAVSTGDTTRLFKPATPAPPAPQPPQKT